MITERWALIEDTGFEVSDFGRVRRIKDGYIRRLPCDSDGYQMCQIKGRMRKVHHLVLEAFVGKRPKGMECRHLNSIRADNRLENLKWGTRSENCVDTVLNGTHNEQRLIPEDVRRIREASFWGARMTDLSRIYGVSTGTIFDAREGSTWKHV